MKFESVLCRLDPPRRRLVIIGDIHGCHDELSELLDRIGPTAKDMVVSTGDIVRKGPDPVRCVQLWQAHGYLAVAGNNEEKVLALAERSAARRLLAPSEDRAVARNRELIDFIRAWPVVIDLPAISITIVHGGLYPGTPLKEEAISRVADDLADAMDPSRQW